jgi:hypothetical protein
LYVIEYVGTPLPISENVKLTLPSGDFMVCAAANIGNIKAIKNSCIFFILKVNLLSISFPSKWYGDAVIVYFLPD